MARQVQWGFVQVNKAGEMTRNSRETFLVGGDREGWGEGVERRKDGVPHFYRISTNLAGLALAATEILKKPS